MSEIEDDGYLIPSSLVTRKPYLFDFLRRADSSMIDDLPAILSNAFVEINATTSFRFVEKTTRDAVCGDVIRVYAVPINSPLLVSSQF